MKVRYAALALLGTLCVRGVWAQSFGQVANDKQESEFEANEERGFTAQVDIDVNLFQFTQERFSDAKQRNTNNKRIDKDYITNYPFGGFNILDDTNVTFGYNGDWYGGKLTVNSGGLGGIKAWVGFFENKLKISAGNDIGYGYADSQGADAGLRVYDDNVRIGKDDGYTNAGWETVDSNKNPDNISQDKGILLEFDLAPLKIALAGGGNMLDLANNHTNYALVNNEPVYGFNFQYGANIGGKIGELAKLNAAYITQAKKDATMYGIGADGKITANGPDSEIWNHLFGAYASVYPLGNDTLGITLGYAGVLMQYLTKFSGGNETNVPQILKSGVNLTARYKTDKLTIKTDHNYSFWADKNYKIFYLYKPDANIMTDYGLLAKTNAQASVTDVEHSFLWNGAGAAYKFTEVMEGSLYIRNLLRTDKAGDYAMTNMYFSVEVKSTFRFTPNVEAYASLVYNYTGRAGSKGLTETLQEFTPPAAPRETNDYVNMVKIPVGLTVKLQ